MLNVYFDAEIDKKCLCSANDFLFPQVTFYRCEWDAIWMSATTTGGQRYTTLRRRYVLLVRSLVIFWILCSSTSLTGMCTVLLSALWWLRVFWSTALDLRCSSYLQGRTSIRSALLIAGCNQHARNRELRSACDLALEKRHTSTVHVLTNFFPEKTSVKRVLGELENDYKDGGRT
jgi:hypothetical protein